MMTTQGEQFTQEEVDEMLTKAVDPLEHTIIYSVRETHMRLSIEIRKDID